MPSPMPYYVTIAGQEVRCDTADELLTLTARGKSASSRANAVSAAEPSGAVATRQQRMVKQSLTFLESIKQAGEGGIGGEKLVHRVGCSGPSGMGTVVQNLNRFIGPRLKQNDVALR